jgi:ketosteroid isomerase-like protein
MHPDQAKIEGAKKLDADFVAAFNKQDPAAAAACYVDSAEAVLYPPGEMEARGRQQIHDCLANVFKSMPGGKLELIDPKYMVSGPNVIATGRWSLKPTNGETLQGRFTEVITKKDGKWSILIDHASMPTK